MMKKIILTFLPLALAAAALILACVTAVSSDDALARAEMERDRLNRENLALEARVEALEQSLQRLQTVASLDSWSLEAKSWSDAAGADITFTAVPAEYNQSISATLLVMLDGQQTAAVPCLWDGSAFTAVVGLNPEDGYSYYCLLQSPGGGEQLLLASPENPAEPVAVFLKSHMERYCNLLVSDWTEEKGKLVLTEAYAQAQLPQLSPEGAVALEGASLELTMNGETVASMPITLSPSEVEGSFDMAITGASFEIPALGEGDVLELYLRVKLSAGEDLTSYGGSWYLENGKLTSVVG